MRKEERTTRKIYKNQDIHFPDDFFLISLPWALVVEHQAIE